MMIPVRGSGFGCYWFLAICLTGSAVLIGLIAVALHWIPPAALVGSLGALVGAKFMEKTSIIEVDEEGLALVLPMNRLFVPWSNVARVKAIPFGAKIVLITPQRMGMRNGRSVKFAFFDPWWSQRPVGEAVAARVQAG